MADINYIVGTDGDDIPLPGGPGVNDYVGGPGNDFIDGTEGVNTIHYNSGDGVDTIKFALPRTYQFSDFLTAAHNGLDELSSFTGSQYSNSYFAGADSSLVGLLPADLANSIGALQQSFVPGTGYIAGSLDPAMAQAAFTSLINWINTSSSNVIQFGPGITLGSLNLQVGATADLGAPQSTPVQFAVAVGSEQGVVFNLNGPPSVAGDTSSPPAIDLTFQFADGTSATLADLMARPNQGVMGTQNGTDGDEFLHGSLGDDTLLGNGGSDKLDGGAGADQLFGGPGDDVISGGSGTDTIYGEDGNDVMAAGKDGSFMSGGTGDDVYGFNRGDGAVNIDNQDWDGSGVDTISFGKDVAPSDLVASLDPSTGNLTLGIAGTNDTITIPWFDAWNGMATRIDEAIDRVQFFDATGTAHVYDLASLVQTAFPDPSAADPTASVELVGSASELSEAAAGGDRARSYALSGNLFAGPNDPPTSLPVIDPTAAQQGAAFSYVVPAATFVDPEGAQLTLTATTADDHALPAWLQFDPATGTFTGTPTNSDVGSLALKVTATDPGGLSASETFNLQVDNVNDAPTVAHAIAQQSATQDADFSYMVPADTFADIDVGDQLTYAATLADGSALPSWLTYVPATGKKLDSAPGTLSGTPTNADVGALSIMITATDKSGAIASTVFGLSVANVNDAPTATDGIAVASATEDAIFTYTLPDGTFSDVDAVDSLTYGATLADGSALPGWLQVDPATGTLSGTPVNHDVGNLSVIVTATDSGNASVSKSISIGVVNTNDAPTATDGIAVASATEDAVFTYTLPDGTFSDVDAVDSLTYGATLADGSALPGWLQVDPATGTLSGTPVNHDVGNLSVIVTATDSGNASVSKSISIGVVNTNDAPTVAQAIADQTATQGAAFSYAVPATTFADVDLNDSMTLSAALATGAALPGWLSFNAGTGKFSGMPANADVGALSIRVTARDGAGASVSNVFNLNIANTNDAPTVAHAMADYSVSAGSPFSMVVPDTTFQDMDAGDALTVSARMANGNPLPGWLQFNAATRTLSGTAGAAGQWDVQLTATDLSGASVSDTFSLTANPALTTGMTINGTNGDDKLYGASGDDKISGGKGKDLLVGGAGNDTFYVSEDGKWGSGATRTNAFSGEKVSIKGLGRSYDVFDGGTGSDTLMGTSGSDAILLDDSKSKALQSGPRIVGVEKIDAGAGNDVVDLTSKRYAYGDVEIDGGSGNDVLWSSSGNDVLRGGSGNDSMDGGAGNDYLEGGSSNDKLNGGNGVDILQGGSGKDTLKDTSGNGLLDGGSGNDTLTEGSGNSMLVGGKGNDHLYLGGGYDIIAFNRGDGRDVVSSGKGGKATLSLGGGISYTDLTLSRSGNDLILDTGKNERITFEKWYEGKKYQAVSKLQVVAEAMPGFDETGSDTLRDDKIETFDFRGLVKAFDTARSHNPGLSNWTLTNALAQFHLGGSDTEALGGDLAYQYGLNGTLAGIAVNAAQDAAGSGQFGKHAQSLHSQAEVKNGLVKLS